MLLDKGDLDWYGDPCGLTPIETIHALGTRLQTKPISAIYWLLCNTKEYHLSSPKIRRAIACAIDRNVLCQFLKGGEIPAHSIIPQQRPSFHFCDGQPSVAKELFQEGLAELKLTQKMFPPVDLSYWSEPACKAIAEILKEQIEQTLGIRVTLHGHDWATQMNNLSSGNFAITTSAWFPLAQDPLLSLNYFKNGGATSTHWQNDTYTQLLDKAEAAEIQEERHSCLEQAERIIMQEMPAIPLYYIAYKFLKNPKLHGEIISSTGAVDFLYLEKSNN